MLHILLADDHPVVRRHVRDVLQSEQDWEVCGEAATGDEAVALTAAKHPDVVVLDLSMPQLNGLQAARLIHERFPAIEMIILTMHDPLEMMDELKAVGVKALIQKDDLNLLVDAIRDIFPRAEMPAELSSGRRRKKSAVRTA